MGPRGLLEARRGAGRPWEPLGAPRGPLELLGASKELLGAPRGTEGTSSDP